MQAHLVAFVEFRHQRTCHCPARTPIHIHRILQMDPCPIPHPISLRPSQSSFSCYAKSRRRWSGIDSNSGPLTNQRLTLSDVSANALPVTAS